MTSYSAKVALLGNLIDYAGTFPPAALSLDKAMVEACAFRRTARHPWLMSKIVVTIQDLKKLSPKAWYEAGADGTPLAFTVIGSAVASADEWARTLSFELREARRFNEKFLESSLRQKVVGYETRMPEDIAAENTASALETLLGTVAGEDGLFLDLFVEIPLGDQWQERLAQATRAFSDWNEENPEAGLCALKIRTGGKTPPTVEQLSSVIQSCVEQGLRFKATQGLHHAISRKSEFGFVNLFAAFCFAQGLGLEAFGSDAIAACLTETRASAFEFGADSLSWSGHRMSVEQMEAARRRYAGTFGSCSLAEPDEFLGKELGER